MMETPNNVEAVGPLLRCSNEKGGSDSALLDLEPLAMSHLCVDRRDPQLAHRVHIYIYTHTYVHYT